MSIHLQEKPKLFNRYYNLNKLLEPNKVLVLYGPRQIGKSTLLNIYLENSSFTKVFLGTGDDNKLVSLFSIPDFDGLIDFAKNYELIVIDEAQLISNIGQGLKIIIDHVPNIKIIVTGSASFELSGQIGEPLVGRKRTHQLYPLSIMELEKHFSPPMILEDLLLYGSYPDVLKAETTEKKKIILEDITTSYLFRDILTLERIKNPKKLTDLLKLLAWQLGNEVSLRELSNSLDIDFKTVERYLDLLEKSFVITSLHGFSRNLRKEVTKSRKYYFVDLGIRNSIIGNFNELSLRPDRGALWENFLLMERLKKREYKKIFANQYFWRTWDKKEIDLVEERDGKLLGYEFKWNPDKKVKAPKDWIETYKNAEFEVITPDNYLDFIT